MTSQDIVLTRVWNAAEAVETKDSSRGESVVLPTVAGDRLKEEVAPEIGPSLTDGALINEFIGLDDTEGISVSGGFDGTSSIAGALLNLG